MKQKKFLTLILLSLIVLIGLIIRLHYFDSDIEPVSDESEYLVMAQSFSNGEIMAQWPYYRPFLIPMIWGLMGKVGAGIPLFILTIIFSSLISIILVYFIGKDLFNEQVGLIAAFLMAFFPEDIAHSLRPLLNSIALTLWLLCLYLFQKAYYKNSNKLLYATAVITGLSILAYTQTIILLGFYLIFLLIFEGKEFIKKLKYISFFVIIIMIYLFNLVYSYIWFDNPIKSFAYGLWLSYYDTHSRSYLSVIIDFFKYTPHYISWILIPVILASAVILVYYLIKILKSFNKYKLKDIKLILISALLTAVLFLIIKNFIDPAKFTDPKLNVLYYGTNTLVTIIFGIIILFILRKFFNDISDFLRKNKEIQKHIFLGLWIIVGLFGVAKMVGAFQARYFMQAVIPFFFYTGFFVTFLYEKLSKYKSYYLTVLIIIVLFFAYSNIAYTTQLSESLNTQSNTKEIGLWINENTDNTDIIIGPRNNAISYFSSRKWYTYPDSRRFDSGDYETFLSVIKEIKPSILVAQPGDNDGVYILYEEFITKNNERVKLLKSFNDKNETISIYSIL